MKRASIIFLLIACIPITSYCQEQFLSDSNAVRVLRGTLLIPTLTKPVPLVLIIAGSGPTDRNGNGPLIKSDCYKILAEGLAKEGIASFRYDKRGIGKSTVKNFREESLVFTDFSDDASAWITRFKTDSRFNKIIVLGHSEGSLLGMIAARVSKADGFISVAGAGRSIDEILKEQLQANPNNPEQLKTDATVILDSLRGGFRVKKINPYLLSIFRPSIQPYMISWIPLDPATELSKLQVPSMIIQGTTDIQVSVTDAERLKKMNPKSTYLLLDGMNHILRDAPAERAANFATYSQPEKPLSAALMPAIISFINSVKKL
jgi:pimeloyl-ACP methyl ester carboxylesterase